MTDHLAGSFVRAYANSPLAAEALLESLDVAQLRNLVRDLAGLLAPAALALRPVETPSGHDLDDRVAALAAATADLQDPAASICALAAQHAAGLFGVTLEDVISRQRRTPVAEARAVAQQVARNCGITLEAIGAYYGGRHHTTVMSSLERVVTKPRLGAIADELTELLLGGHQLAAVA